MRMRMFGTLAITAAAAAAANGEISGVGGTFRLLDCGHRRLGRSDTHTRTTWTL